MEDIIKQFYEDIKKSRELCPWAKEQKLNDFLKELEKEIKEARVALKKNDDENLKEELGDIFWDTLSILAMAEKERKYDAKEIISNANKKLRRRKPYIFGDMKIDTKKQAVKIWNEIKQKEKEGKK